MGIRASSCPVQPAGVDRLWSIAPGVVGGVIHGPLPNKSNRRQIVRGRLIKSREAIQFNVKVGSVVRGAQLAQLVGATSKENVKRGLPFLYFHAHVFGASFARDLDCELLPDCLQNAGLINNDRAIREKHYWWALDQVNPRVEFEIGYMGRQA